MNGALKPAVVMPRDVETLHVLGGDLRFLCDAATTAGRFSLIDSDIPLGSGPPPHRHDWDEMHYIVSGAVDFFLAGEKHHVGPGTLLFAPAGVVHGFTGASEEPARSLVFDIPAHATEFFRQVDREVRGPEDYARVTEIGAAHGIMFENA